VIVFSARIAMNHFMVTNLAIKKLLHQLKQLPQIQNLAQIAQQEYSKLKAVIKCFALHATHHLIG
jgi:hypothetical protein